MPANRVPTKLKKLRGTVNVTKDRGKTDQDFPCLSEDSIVEAPDVLSEKAKASWYRITQPLILVGALHELDLDLLTQGLLLQDELDEIQEQISVLLAKKKRTEAEFQRWSKLNALRNKNLVSYIKIMSAFGVSPSARASISNLVQRKPGITSEEKEANPILAVLGDLD